jgi:hypothetical protein
MSNQKNIDEISLRKFNIKSILPDSTIVAIARRRSGKSWLLRDILFHHKEIPSGIVFSGTEQASPFFSEFIPDCFIHTEYDPDVIQKAMLNQRKKIRDAKDKGLSNNGKHPSNNFFIILDDMLHEAATWKRDTTMKSIFFNGRHYNLMFFLTMQYPFGITPDLRSNIDYVFLFNEPNIKNRKKLYEDYCGMLPSFSHFCAILDDCTLDHGCLVIKTSGNSNDIRDQVFWYKAEPHDNFRVGHKSIWKYHDNHFNPKYEAHQDQVAEKVNNLNKSNKSKKLKVLVSRTTGDIEDYYEESN